MLLLIEHLVTEYDLARHDTYLNHSVQPGVRLFLGELKYNQNVQVLKIAASSFTANGARIFTPVYARLLPIVFMWRQHSQAQFLCT